MPSGRPQNYTTLTDVTERRRITSSRQKGEVFRGVQPPKTKIKRYFEVSESRHHAKRERFFEVSRCPQDGSPVDSLVVEGIKESKQEPIKFSSSRFSAQKG
jgi:hypothetical protein